MEKVSHQRDFKKYKVRAQGISKCPDTSTCRLEISVGQPYHEGAKLEATLDWAERFDRVVIIVCDEPQAFNIVFKEGINLSLARKKGEYLGEQWLTRNRKLLGKHPRFEIRRWAEWKSSEEYDDARDEAERLFHINSKFNSSLVEALDGVFIRNNFPEERYEHFRSLSLQYLFEETAVFSLAHGELKGFSAYPGSFLGIWSMFAGKELSGPLSGLSNSHYAKIKFSVINTDLKLAA